MELKAACGLALELYGMREYTVRVDTAADKAYSIGRFNPGLPPLSKNRNVGNNRWSLHKEGMQGRQLTGNMLEKYYNRKPWILEDETCEYQYQGQTDGLQFATATYYLLMMQGKEFNTIPVGLWYNFSKVVQYKQLTLEEAEEKKQLTAPTSLFFTKICLNWRPPMQGDSTMLPQPCQIPNAALGPHYYDNEDDVKPVAKRHLAAVRASAPRTSASRRRLDELDHPLMPPTR
ncbi:hypothetical protein EJB05_28038, partial [Eragrostis curvula]